MSITSSWIVGGTGSGKTTRLLQFLCPEGLQEPEYPASLRPVLVFAATGDNRLELADRIAIASQGTIPVHSTTPLGFFQDEVTLFWPLLMQQLNLKVQFPLRLRPETEQELATLRWQEDLEQGRLRQEGIPPYYVVRRSLDLLQLAGVGGIPTEDIPALLNQGFPRQESDADQWQVVGECLLHWRQWCLERGLLTYGILAELYWRHLLPDRAYQESLAQRYRLLLADDVDEYPAIAHDLFTVLLDQGIPGLFTFNPNGATRLGLGADPDRLAQLAARCQQEVLPSATAASFGNTWGLELVQWVSHPLLPSSLPDAIQVLQTTSRAQLLRQTAETIATAIHAGEVTPEEVAVVGPGLDAIARYTLREILANRGVAVRALNDQQPLASSPMIRALLTLLALVYPGLGRLVDREAIAEMLVILSQAPTVTPEQSGLELSTIDPVRAGLLTDHCFVPDPEQPKLLPATSFPRWDRLGFRAVQTYSTLLQWLEGQQQQQQQRLIPSPVVLLDRAIQHFLQGGSHFSYDRLSLLRELMETAQHYWEVDTRLRQSDLTRPRSDPAPSTAVAAFIQLLRNGTITADPYPVRPLGTARQAVTLSTIFQYRATRCRHRWQFWLDAGSPFWLTGGTTLFGAPLFLQSWSGRPWTAADELALNEDRLRRQMLDLMHRTGDRLYLCYSDLATSGQEQNGPLITLVHAASNRTATPNPDPLQ